MARRDEAEATLQNLMAVATSDWAISAVPLTSAGLSGSLGSAAIRSQRTRSADCVCPGELATETAISADRPIPRLTAMNPALGRFAMSDAMSAPPAHATCNSRTAGIGHQAVDQRARSTKRARDKRSCAECCAL